MLFTAFFSSLNIGFLLNQTRYQTSNPERAKLRKHLFAPFSTANLQKTTMGILNDGVRRLLGRLREQAGRGEPIDVKKVSSVPPAVPRLLGWSEGLFCRPRS